MALLHSIMTMPGSPHTSGMRVVGEEIMARAEAMQVGCTIGVAKIEVFSKNEGVERLCLFGIATLRAVAPAFATLIVLNTDLFAR